jgi:hypothetical protein
MVSHNGKNRGDTMAAYRRAKGVGEGSCTWLTVPFIDGTKRRWSGRLVHGRVG